MGRLIYMIITILAFNLGMYLFACSSWGTDGRCITGYIGDNSTIWDYAMHPFIFSGDVDDNSLWKTIFGLGGISTVVGGIFVTAGLWTGSDIFLFLGVGLALLPQMGIFIKFHQQILNSAYFTGRSELGWVVALMVMTPVILAWIFIIIDWIRGRD